MKHSLLAIFLGILLGCSEIMCTPVSVGHDVLVAENATDTTCNDPSTSVIYYEGFSPGRTAHMLQQHSSFVNADSQGGEDLQIQAAAFRAWSTPQTGTFAFWRLAAAGSPTPDWVFAMSSTDNPPVLSGFSAPTIIAYVYPTQICNSVPLYVLYLPSKTNHYYSIDPIEQQNLISFGWTDQGVAAFVLPV